MIDRYFKHRHSIHKGPFHIYIYISTLMGENNSEPKVLDHFGGQSMQSFSLCNLVMFETLHYMAVSKNNGTPKWMVYHGKPY